MATRARDDGGARGSRLRTLGGLAAVLLLALPTRVPVLEWLAPIVPLPTLLLVATSPRLSFVRAWLTASVGVAVGLWWLNAVHPVATVVCGLFFGLYGGFGAWSAARLHAARLPMVVVAPLCVLGYETLVQRFAPFPSTWLAFGALAWRQHDLAQLASVGGVSLVSAAIWLPASGVADAILAARREGAGVLRTARGLAPPLAGLAAFGIAWLAGHAMLPAMDETPVMRIALVQGNVAQSLRLRPENADAVVQRHAEMTAKQVAPGSVDVVAWPESTASLPLEQDEEALRFLASLSTHVQAPLLVGAIGLNFGDAPSNSAFLVEEHGLSSVRCDKRCLVPGAETLLVLDRIPAVRSKLGDFLSRTMHFRPFLKRGVDAVVMTARGVPFGAMICYDDVIPEPAQELRAKGARALVTITNEAWFGKGELWQHAALASYRCIETRLPMARCGNDGLSCAYDAAGRLTASIPVRTQDVLVTELRGTSAAPVPPVVRTTIAWSSVTAVIVLLVATRARRRGAA